MIKPDLVAPAVNVTAPIPGGGYDALTGTSIAAPHVTGAAALLLEWGIVEGNDPFLYGQRLKAYLRLGARRSNNLNYPNKEWGFGSLCLSESLYNLQISTQSFEQKEDIKIQEFENIPEAEPFNDDSEHEAAIYSNNYLDFILEYNTAARQVIQNNPYIKFCNIIDNRYAIIHVPRENFRNFFETEGNKLVIKEPYLLGLMDTSSLDASGITAIQNQPYLSLRGQGVLIGIVDTGIDYTNKAFVYEDGTSKIVSLWDQTIQGGNHPPNHCYGSEYTNEQINEALSNENPRSIIPSTDEIGHGTFLASVSAGREIPEDNFVGAAPDSELVVVKLKQAKEYIKSNMLLPPNTIAYQSSDLMNGLDYIFQKASELNKPVAICVALGTNEGGHNGFSIIEQYISDLSSRNGVAISVAAGNEATARHHAIVNITEMSPTKSFEIRVGENEEGFPIYIWSYVYEHRGYI